MSTAVLEVSCSGGTMHVYLRQDLVDLEMRQVDAEGMIPEDSELVAVAFFVTGNERPSFRALLPPDTIEVLEEAVREPVQLGLLAEEPDDPAAEIHAMVGLSVAVSGPMAEELGAGETETEPWQSDEADAWRPDAWKQDEPAEDAPQRTALLAFAPLVRLRRRFPDSFGEELADLLESALTGETRPHLEARIDDMLDEL